MGGSLIRGNGFPAAMLSVCGPSSGHYCICVLALWWSSELSLFLFLFLRAKRCGMVRAFLHV